MVYFHMARQISTEMFLIRGSGESAPHGWRFSKMRAEGGLRGRLGAHTDDLQEKNTALTAKIISESSGTNSCSWCTEMYKKTKKTSLVFFCVLPTTSKSESIDAIR